QIRSLCCCQAQLVLVRASILMIASMKQSDFAIAQIWGSNNKHWFRSAPAWPEGTHIPEKVFLALERAIATNDDDQVLSAVITAAFSLFQRGRSDETRVVSIIAGALAKGQQFAIHAAAVVFGFHSNELTPALFETLVPS